MRKENHCLDQVLLIVKVSPEGATTCRDVTNYMEVIEVILSISAGADAGVIMRYFV